MRFLDEWRATSAVGLDLPLTYSLMKPLSHVGDHDDQTALTIDDEFLVGQSGNRLLGFSGFSRVHMTL